MTEVSPGALPLMSTSLGPTPTASAKAPSATEMRSMVSGLSTTSDLPTVTVQSSTVGLGEVTTGG